MVVFKGTTKTRNYGDEKKICICGVYGYAILWGVT